MAKESEMKMENEMAKAAVEGRISENENHVKMKKISKIKKANES